MGDLTPRQAVALYGCENPFASPAALRASNYCAHLNGRLVRLLDSREPLAQARLADKAVRAFILSSSFSCVAGKAAVSSGGYRFGYYGGFGEGNSTEGLARDLAAFVAERPFMERRYASFIAVFDGSGQGGEDWFESALWRELQLLSDLAAPLYARNARVASDPDANDFAFSFASEAFFVVGMHRESSRLSRRFSLPTLVFNSHDQFAEARRDGRFQRIQRIVRGRELQLQGSINPELREFGTASEARQYSGRPTEESWKCPFLAPS
jgi:FPC/CPF motif-containing protein YcgG